MKPQKPKLAAGAFPGLWQGLGGGRGLGRVQVARVLHSLAET